MLFGIGAMATTATDPKRITKIDEAQGEHHDVVGDREEPLVQRLPAREFAGYLNARAVCGVPP